MRLYRLLPVLLIAALALPAAAGPVLDRIKADRLLHCGAVERPGLATMTESGWNGLAVDMCRAVAAAVLGSADAVTFTDYDSPDEYARIAHGDDSLFFLTGNEIHLHQLDDKTLPGPVIFYESHAVMVPTGSKAQRISDLAGKKICYITGSRVERSLADYFQRANLSFLHMAFTEDGEMVDAYGARKCEALAYEITTLATLPGDMAFKGQPSRILQDPLVTFPVMAVTGIDDAQFSAIVAWTVDTVIAAERAETPWYSGGAGAMPVTAPALGLDSHWQARVLAAVGHYGTIYDRHFGKDSGLVLARGPNANQASGGLLLAPFLE